jgi:N-acetylmuramoyl-L-alanine amidase
LTRVSLTRRRLFQWTVVPVAHLAAPALAWASIGRIASARVWPADEYTRVVFETPAGMPYRVQTITDPHRVVIELDGIALTPELAQLPTRIQASDPYIASIRFGTSGTTLRIVFDLKSQMRTQVFVLKPVAEFGYRLVLDLYPLIPLDPLMALLKERGEPADAEVKPAAPAPERMPAERTPAVKPETSVATGRRRMITVALDPGHGGEDPGAIGRRGTHEKDVTLAIGRKLKRLVDAEPGMRAMLTRDADYYVPLAARVQKARRVEADLFVSIHADAFRETNARGSSVFAM